MRTIYVVNSMGKVEVAPAFIAEGIPESEWFDITEEGGDVCMVTISKYDLTDGIGRVVYDDTKYSEEEVLKEVAEIDEKVFY